MMALNICAIMHTSELADQNGWTSGQRPPNGKMTEVGHPGANLEPASRSGRRAGSARSSIYAEDLVLL